MVVQTCAEVHCSYTETQAKQYLIEYLQWNLTEALKKFHRVLGLSDPDGGWEAYEYTTLVTTNVLTILGVIGCRGHDDDVVFVVADRRQNHDRGPQGIAIRTGPLYVHLTRGCKRTHYIDMDMSHEITLPRSLDDPLTREGMDLD